MQYFLFCPRAAALPQQDTFSGSDLYVECVLFAGSAETARKRTAVVRNDNRPTFAHEEMLFPSHSGDRLVVMVKDRDLVSNSTVVRFELLLAEHRDQLREHEIAGLRFVAGHVDVVPVSRAEEARAALEATRRENTELAETLRRAEGERDRLRSAVDAFVETVRAGN